MIKSRLNLYRCGRSIIAIVKERYSDKKWLQYSKTGFVNGRNVMLKTEMAVERDTRRFNFINKLDGTLSKLATDIEVIAVDVLSR